MACKGRPPTVAPATSPTTVTRPKDSWGLYRETVHDECPRALLEYRGVAVVARDRAVDVTQEGSAGWAMRDRPHGLGRAMSDDYAKVVRAAFERPQESFETTCPILGITVTRYAKTGDHIKVRGADGRLYCIADTVRSLLHAPLTDAAQARVRTWLRRAWHSGTECPMIRSGQVQEAIDSGATETR